MTNIFQTKKARQASLWLALILAVCLLLYAAWGITTDIVFLQYQGLHPVRRHHLLLVPQPGRFQTSQIQSWMTFGFLNTVFNLPQDYLKTALHITDNHYPNLSIGSLAKEQNKTSSQEISIIQQVIASYLNSKSQGIRQ